MTTEAPNSLPPDATETSPPDDTQLFMALLWTFLSLLCGNETTIPSTLLRVLYLATLAAPFIIIAITALRRRFFSAPMPSRWLAGSRALRRLPTFLATIMALAILLLGSSIIMRSSAGRHDLRYTSLHDAGYFLLGWGYVLAMYIADRRPLPPPRKSSYIWADMKPLHSDHWGRQAQS